MQKFIKINNLNVKKYYLLFILDKSNYRKKEKIEAFTKYNFSYIIYDYERKKFDGQLNEDLFEIKYTVNAKEDININTTYYIFGNINYSFVYNYQGKIHKYYAEQNWSLDRFFNEIFDDNLLKHEFMSKTGIALSDYYLNSVKTQMDILGPMSVNTQQILFLNLENNIIYYGVGKTIKDFKWYSYDILGRVKKCIRGQLRYSTGKCFLFYYEKYKKIVYPKKNK